MSAPKPSYPISNKRGLYVRLDPPLAKRLEEEARAERRTLCAAATVLIERGLANLALEKRR